MDDLRISPAELDAAVRYTIERTGSVNAMTDLIKSLLNSIMLSKLGVSVALMICSRAVDAECDLAFILYFSGIVHGRASLHADELLISPEELEAAAYRVKALKLAGTCFSSMIRELMRSATIGAVVNTAIDEGANPNMAIGAYATGLMHGRVSMLPPDKVN